VARLVDGRKLRVRVLLDPARVLDVQVEARAQARVHARPGEVFAGTVLRVGEVVDPMTRKLPIEVELQDTEGRLRPGLVARVQVETGPPRTAMTVDENAVFERFRRSYVFVVENGKAERTEIVPGELRDGRIEITRGLDGDERVITAGLDRVADGAPVREVEPQVQAEAQAAPAKTQASSP
jgi:membrane fusion protein (multidrug efflux system)